MRTPRLAATAQLALVVGISAGCASVLPPSRPAPADTPASTRSAHPVGLNLSGFPIAYREGYAIGCDSGRAGGRRRDESRYGADANYKMGWDDGHSICVGRK